MKCRCLRLRNGSKWVAPTIKIMKSLALCLLTTIAALSAATDKPEDVTFLTPEQAGPDFADQGEYRNDWGGAQVIALGAGKFQMVTYRGGLPGDGWDKEFRQQTPGQRQGDNVVFTGPNEYRAELAHGTISITTSSGGPYTMEKTVRKSPTLGEKPPLQGFPSAVGAVVLFDGSSASAWQDGHMDQRGLLMAGCTSKQSFQDFKVHLEFLLPFKPFARGQERANSGVYLQDRYEVQVLDSFGLEGKNDDCGGIYSQAAPLVNASFPPLTWQTYDIDFKAARFDENGKKTSDAVVTVRQNGITIHDHLQLKGPTPGGRKEDAQPGPLQLQGHGNPVFFRNVWVVTK